MSTHAHEIARRVFLKVAASRGIYLMSPEGFDMAEACSFVDSTDIGLSIALACEIASQAEDTIESGGSYRAEVLITDMTGRNSYRQRVNALVEAGGMEALYEDMLKYPAVVAQIENYVKSSPRKHMTEFLQGIMPIPNKPRQVEHIQHSLGVIYGEIGKQAPYLKDTVSDITSLARGILRDLDLELEDGQLSVDVKSSTTKDTMKVGVYLNNTPFYVQDPLLLRLEDLRPTSTLPAEKFLKTKGNLSFEKVFIGTKDLSAIAVTLQGLNACLNHPKDEVKAQAQEWVSSQEGLDYLYKFVVYNNYDSSKEVRAAARGFIKRIVKDFDNANFGVRDVREAKEFFGKDTQMLIQKCWNKSALKQSFGAFKTNDRMLDFLIRVICKRLNPSIADLNFYKGVNPELITDVVVATMIQCALTQMGVTARPDFKKLFRL